VNSKIDDAITHSLQSESYHGPNLDVIGPSLLFHVSQHRVG